MVQNNSLDIIEGYPHGQKETEAFVNIKKSWDLQDTWGKANRNNKDFTWSRKNPFIARRLDYTFYDSLSSASVVKSFSKVMAGTDHKAVVIESEKSEFKRGPSKWKLYTSYLKESAFVQQINACISKSLEESEREGLDGITTWELLKATIRSE